jgi:hypothetical protein
MPGETKKQQSDHNADISLSECEDRIYHNFSNRKIPFRSWTRKKVVFFQFRTEFFRSPICLLLMNEQFLQHELNFKFKKVLFYMIIYTY